MKLVVTPVGAKERIVLLDVLRGLALFGILFVNMPLFNNSIVLEILGTTNWNSPADQITRGIIKFFFEGKFVAMFSLLFGYGFWLFIHKTTVEGKSLIPIYIRRAVILSLMGAAHIALFWAGDILFFYGLLGLILILFRNVRDSRILKTAISLIFIPSLLMLLSVIIITLVSANPQINAEINSSFDEARATTLILSERALQVYSLGTYSEMISLRITEWSVLLNGVFFFYPVVLGMFMFGMWAARKDLAKNYTEHIPFFKKVFVWGLIIGLPANIIYTYAAFTTEMNIPSLNSFLGFVGYNVGGVAFCLMYVSGIVLLANSGKMEVLSQFFAPIGRMALTNYLLQTLICTTLFYAYGFALFGKVSLWQGALIAIIIFSIQVPLSKFWLKHFRFGPFEWLWRTMTYFKWQPLKQSVEK